MTCDLRCVCGSSSDLLREKRDYRISPCVDGEERLYRFSPHLLTPKVEEEQ